MGDHFDVVEALLRLPYAIYDGANDTADRMNFLGTCIIMVMASLMITLREFMMDPVSCFIGVNPGGENFLKYVENFCWTEGTMSIQKHHKIPDTDAEWEKYLDTRLVYYQWAPIMLMVQSAMFFLPSIIWNVVCFNFCGIDVHKLIKDDSDGTTNQIFLADIDVKDVDPTDFSNTTNTLFHYLLQIRGYKINHIHPENSKLKVYTKHKSRWPLTNCLKSQIYLYYFLTKCCYLLNCLLQLYLMHKFLGLSHLSDADDGSQIQNSSYSSMYGIELLRDFANGRKWPQTGAFPRSAYCMVRVTLTGGNRNTQVAQCVLTANMIIEKIYIFLWFWIVLVGFVTFVSCLLWCLRLFSYSRVYRIYERYLRANYYHYLSERVLTKDCSEFCRNFLGLDGIFLLTMVSINRGDVTSSFITAQLFKRWKIEIQKSEEKNEFLSIIK